MALPKMTQGLDTIREGRRSFLGAVSSPSVTMAVHQQRPQTVPGVGSSLNRTSMTASMPSPVRVRENKPPRKPRPASVASSMPSFVGVEPAKSPRSKSTDRTGRDRVKVRPPRKNSKAPPKDKEDVTDNGEENIRDKDGDKDSTRPRSAKKERVSLSFFDRLATPKFNKKEPEPSQKETLPKKDTPIIRVQFADDDDQDGIVEPKRSVMKEKASPSQTKEPAIRHVPSKEPHRTPGSAAHVQTPTAASSRSTSPGRKEGEKHPGRSSSVGQRTGDKPVTSAPRVTPPSSATSTPTHGPAPPASTPASSAATPSQPSATSAADDGTITRNAGGPAQDITAEEYKARLAEKRRQAREKAEKEAEEERRRQEEARLSEEERQRKEEEEERRLEEEALRLAESAQKAEEERLQKAIEAEEKRRKEEVEKLEQERKIKEESERKAKEESERLDKEKQEKAKKEEEERLQRKKKLEMIMKRVKTDSSLDGTQRMESPSKMVSGSPNISQLNSSQNSPEEHEKPVASSESSDEDISGLAVAEGSAVETYSAAMTTSFMQDLEESDMTASTSSSASTVIHSEMPHILDGGSTRGETSDDAEVSLLTSSTLAPSKSEEKPLESSTDARTKFRSPLLQQLVENKGDSASSGPKFKSPLLQNLLGKTKVGARMGLSSSSGDLTQNRESSTTHDNSMTDSSMTLSTSSVDNGGISKESFKRGGDDEDRDEDTSVQDASEPFKHVMTNGIRKGSGDANFPTSSSKSSFDSSPLEATRLPISMMSDSALGSSIEPHGDGVMSQSTVFNGSADNKSHSLEDSSISLYSVEESVANPASVIPFETLPESERQEEAPSSQGDGQFEEFIDLIESSGKNGPLITGRPIRAFEENNRRPDVTEFLS